MTDNAIPSASEVAEDYRGQRQEADARKAGIVPAGKQVFTGWLDNNVGLLRKIAVRTDRQNRRSILQCSLTLTAFGTTMGRQQAMPSGGQGSDAAW